MTDSIRKFMKLLRKYLQEQKGKLLALMLLLVLTTGVQLVNPQILRFFIDSALGQAEMSVLLYTTIVYILVSVLYQGLKVASTYLCQLIGWSSTNKLREDLIDHCMHLDMTFHETKQPGEMIERLESDIHKLFDFFSSLCWT